MVSFLSSSEKIYSSHTVFEEANVTYDKKTKKPINGLLVEDGIHLPYNNGKLNGCSYSEYYDGFYHQLEMYRDDRVVGPVVTYHDNGNISKIMIIQNENIERELNYYKNGSLRSQMEMIDIVDDMYTFKLVSYDPFYNKHAEAIFKLTKEGKKFTLISGFIFGKNKGKRNASMEEIKMINTKYE